MREAQLFRDTFGKKRETRRGSARFQVINEVRKGSRVRTVIEADC